LADEAGSGKTAVVCALLTARPLWPTLILAPNSIVGAWEAALRRWLPRDVTVHASFHASTTDRSGLGAWLKSRIDDGELHVVLAPHSCLAGADRLPVHLRDARRWGRLVVDEAHVLRNHASLSHRFARKLAGRSAARWAVTATPVQNAPADLVSILRSALDCRCDDPEEARRRFVLSRVDEPPSNAADAEDGDAACRIPASPAQGLQVFTARVELAAEGERACYDAQAARAEVARASGRSTAVLEALLRCSQAATHRALLSPDESAARSSKFEWLARALPASGAKSIVFCDWVGEMQLLAARLREDGASCWLMCGEVGAQERQGVLEAFERGADARRAEVLIAQTRCGGVGLNIQCASRVYFMRPAVNPAVEYQAIARAFRRGQTRHVQVYRMVAADTVDEQSLAHQGAKRAHIRQVMGTQSISRALRACEEAVDML
jgi:SNF2 family DNA or RNA helicase